MIGSTLSRMAAAEKLSIPQLQQAIQNGTIPAYVGIPLLQEKVKMEQRMKMSAAGAQQGTPPTVADQVMQEATAEEMQSQMPQGGVDQLPVEAPAMAGGGIVAFADGGDTDEYAEEIEDQEEDKRRASTMRKIMALGELPEGAANMSYGDVAGGKLAAGQKAGAYKGITGDHKYSDMIRSEAKKAGLDPEYALKIAMIESGGIKNPEAVRSKAGAIGIMQLMPATAKGLGVENPEDPAQNIRGGVSMLKRLVDKYGDYELAGAAYNAGEGRVDRALRSGKGLAGLPSETQGYMSKIRGMKEGGIAHFDDGGITTYDPFTGEPYTPEGEGQLSRLWSKAKRATGFGYMLPESERGWSPEEKAPVVAPTKATPKPTAPVAKPAETYVAPTTKPAAPPVEAAPVAVEPQQTKPASENYFEKWMQEKMSGLEGKRAEQAEQDKWLSVLAAGLGMMGGTSPYAAANIGQGAMAGVSNYAQARKQAAAQEAADTKSMLTAQRYKSEDELARAQLANQEKYRTATLGGKDTGRMEGILNRLENTYMAKAKAAAENELTPEKKKAAYDAAYAGLYQDPVYKKVYTSYFGESPTVIAPSAPAGFRIVK